MLRPNRSPERIIAAVGILVTALVAVPSTAADSAPEIMTGAAGEDRQRVLIHFVGTPETAKALDSTTPQGDEPRLHAVREVIDAALPALYDEVASGDLAIGHIFRLQATISAEVSPEGLTSLSRNSAVNLVEPDRTLQLQTFEGLQVIGADDLHQLDISGEGTAVAIIDTGVDYLHPTLGGGQIPNAKIVFGLDTADGDDDPMDCHGHGTAVASVAAGASYQWSPSRRFAGGVAPAAKILAYKVTSDSGCRTALTSSVVAAVEDAVLRREGDGYRLAAINISLGAGEYRGPCDAANVTYANAIRVATEAGISVIAASGNDGYTGAISVPACLTGAISVGAAWDADTGGLPFSFCLDPTCERSCDDSHRFRRSVCCYSNSSPHLDLIAPSEFLKAAARDGVTVDFGGTSGASAYVTGAAALLQQALGELSPSTAKFVLSATGVPSMDDKNGLIRSVIDLESALRTAGKVVVSEPVSIRIPPLPDSPTRSSIYVDRPNTVGSLKVLVDLAHPNPEHIRLSLNAPDGTRAVLHDRGPGFEGIAGTYPDDLQPVESLGTFAGVPMEGTWYLEVEDLRSQASGNDETILISWALKLEEPSQPKIEDTTMIYPVVAHAEGSMDTHWRSDVRIFNPINRQDTEIRLHFIPPSGDDVLLPRQADVIVPHGSVVALDDVVERNFGLDAAHGSLLIEDPTGTIVHGTSRTYTIGEIGTYGQFVAPEVGGVHATGAGEPSLVVLPNAGPDHRVNVGVTEITGRTATVAMTLIDSNTGVALGPSTFFEVSGFSNIQLNHILPDVDAGASVDPYVALTVVQGEGRVTAYGSIIDNLSGDAVFATGAAPRVTPFLLVPVVARNEGQGGTQWRSDLRVLNNGSFSIHVDAELRFHGAIGLPPVTESFELQPGQAATIEDVVGSLFGYESGVGSLRLVPREGPAALFATSRTANHGGAIGTFGQYVPALGHGDGLQQRGVLLHVDKGPATRSNLGLVETEGLSVGVAIRLLDEHGFQLGSITRMTLGPWESLQLNDVFSALGAVKSHNARIELTQDAGSGRFFAYASVIDSDSGDAIFVPVQPIVTPTQ